LLVTYAALGPALLHGHETVGLLDSVYYRLSIQRPQRSTVNMNVVQNMFIRDCRNSFSGNKTIQSGQRGVYNTLPQVDDLDTDTLLFKVLSNLQGSPHHLREGDDGHVLALALDLGLAEGDEEVLVLRLVGHGERGAVQQLVLQHHHGVLVADGGLHKSSGVLRGPGGHHLEAGHGAVPRGEALRVLGSHSCGGAVGPAEHNGNRHVTTGHVELLSGGVDDLVDGLHGEVEGHELHDGAQALVGGAGGDTSKAHLWKAED
jgi:hypothetical protein